MPYHRWTSRRRCAALLVLLAAAACTSGGDRGDDASPKPTPPQEPTWKEDDDPTRVSNPTLTEATGGRGEAIGGMRYDVGEFGYEEREYLFEGTAETYPPADLPPAPYKSRMIVWTPTDPDDFNGTTVVEWAHVSDIGQWELTVELNYQSLMLQDEGYAFALVSAEEGGVCDETPKGCTPTSLEMADPERYGSLDHPGDAYAFGIFSQALQAIKFPNDVAPLGGLDPGIVIAEGFQPSIDKYSPVGHPNPEEFTSPFSIYGPLNAYLASGADDAAQVADGFFIDAAAPRDEPTYRVPTLHHLDESAIRREPTVDTEQHVTWEVVGAPHADRWASDHIRLPSASDPTPKLTHTEEEARLARLENYGQLPDDRSGICQPFPRTGTLFPKHYTIKAALSALQVWIDTGERAPSAPRIERVGPPPTSASQKLARDPDGNAIRGLRSPIIDVPVSTYDGEECIQAGTSAAYTPDRLAELYTSHEDYVQQLLAAVDTAVDDRFLRCADAETIMRGASTSPIGGEDDRSASPRCTNGAE